MGNDQLDKGIAIVIMLFILSLIAERFVTWVKLYFGKGNRSLIFFSALDEDLTIRKQDAAQEKLREQKITGLTIVLSILIAILAKADLFSILSSDPPYNGIGWKDFSLKGFFAAYPNRSEAVLKILVTFFGCVLTGFFISLGTKFWHDLLDLLLYSKNLKKKLSDPETYVVSNVDELTEFLQFTEPQLVRLAIEQNGPALRARFPNIEFLNDSIAVINGERRDVLGIYLQDANTSGIPEKVPVKLPSGRTYQVVTEVIADIGFARISGGMDGSVRNDDLSGYTGSGCCIVTDHDQQHFMLTNCHVLTGGYFRNPAYDTGEPLVRYEEKKIGNWHFGQMSSMGDFALVKINDIDEFINDYDPELFRSKLRVIEKEDWLKEKVIVRGNKCKTFEDAYVIEVVPMQVRVEYKDGTKLKLDEALLLGDRPDKEHCRPVTIEGDSGGAVYDEDKRLIAIIVSVGNKFTYAIPLAKFLRKNDLTIKSSV